jgi:hypothetical protein
MKACLPCLPEDVATTLQQQNKNNRTSYAARQLITRDIQTGDRCHPMDLMVACQAGA